MPQASEVSLEDMGRHFRLFVADSQKQRTFHKDELLKLLTRYAQAMTPEFDETGTVEFIKNKIIKNPEATRKTMLESCIVSNENKEESRKIISKIKNLNNSFFSRS